MQNWIVSCGLQAAATDTHIVMQNELLPNLFRTEFSKITAVLCKRFGLDQMSLAEDIVSDTFLLAAETWGLQGIPSNPTAWLYTVAKNKALDQLRRQQLFEQKIAPQIGLTERSASSREDEIDLSLANIKDSQLQMMFAVCHPAIAPEAQIGLALRILCGFGIEEIADAFLTNKEVINKRLYRAKTSLRKHQVQLVLPPLQEISARLDTVLHTLYLLFNEGYYSASQNAPLRKDLCLEAMRLAYLLLDDERTALPKVKALLALMCFHASRFEARTHTDQEAPIQYADQDQSLWDRDLIRQGELFLNQAAIGEHASQFHFEAAIAYWHTRSDTVTEKWPQILGLYDALLNEVNSPITALSRAYAVSKVKGVPAGIAAAEALALEDNHYYHSLLGQLYQETEPEKGVDHLLQALQLAKTEADKATIKKLLEGN
ncbi:MAG: RNA polymerase sigma factor [Bacteroidia bacterium]